MSCKALFTDEFLNRLDDKAFSDIRGRIIEKIKYICECPLANKTYPLKHSLLGKRVILGQQKDTNYIYLLSLVSELWFYSS